MFTECMRVTYVYKVYYMIDSILRNYTHSAYLERTCKEKNMHIHVGKDHKILKKYCTEGISCALMENAIE